MLILWLFLLEAYGLLAAHPVAPLVTLHHFDSLKPIFPFAPTPFDALERLVRASRADPGRTLQQTIVYPREENWSISVSWGYTVQLYPSILTPKELTTALQTFTSWRTWSPGPFTFDIRPWENDECRQPLLYFLDKVEALKDRTITTYERYDEPGRAHCGTAEYEDAGKVESIKVLGPKMELGEWKKVFENQSLANCEFWVAFCLLSFAVGITNLQL